jgi:hypothetical protein
MLELRRNIKILMLFVKKCSGYAIILILGIFDKSNVYQKFA